MAVDHSYRCNLCREAPRDPLNDLVGLHYSSWPKGWTEKPVREVENHICMQCLSSLQALPARCGHGFLCKGGPNCGSDHK